MTKKKLAIVVALAGLVALVAVLAYATTDACIMRIATGPMTIGGGMTTTFDVYAYHIEKDNCDCNHDAGTLTLSWKYYNEEYWRVLDEMTPGVVQWCGVQEYEYTGFEVTRGSKIDLNVTCDEHEDCYVTVLGFNVP